MISITLNDGTKITYNTFDEIVDYCKNQIIELNCSDNNLSSLSYTIGDYINLKILNCSYNELTTLPPSIGYLTNLTHLYCYGNNLTSLPDSICDLTNLEELNLSSNNLVSLPDLIGNLINLKVLRFFRTNITSVPESIINLRNIWHISEIGNKTPQQQRYYDWIESDKKTTFDEYYEKILTKCAHKLS
jgi:Leucine-rich repeat (LRR) protein